MAEMAENVLSFSIKRCPHCAVVKSVSDFGKSTKDGLQSYCKKCNSEQALENYYLANPNRRRDRRINFIDKTRQCTDCEQWKQWEEFTTHGGKPYPYSKCRVCVMKMHRQKRQNNPVLYAQAQRRADLKTKYGITVEQYEDMLKAQGYCCKLCRSKNSGRKSGVFIVDHDHGTGKVRGILCARCNVGLGHFDDDPSKLRTAIAYLEKE